MPFTLSSWHDAGVSWHLTDDVDAFAGHAWDLLAADPAEHTVPLGIVEQLRAGHRWSDAPALFGWHVDGDAVRGAVCMTPPFEMVLAVVPPAALAELVATLRARDMRLPGVHGEVATVERFARAWLEGTALGARTVFEQRLYVLGALEAPDPPPPGRPRAATEAERDLAARWLTEFQREAEVHLTDAEQWARAGIGDGRIWLWEDEGAVVSLAARTATVAGVARVAPVYTPPVYRRRGYGAAVTAACTQDAIDRGAEHVVLFTDLANPTSNAIYQRIGYRPLSDRRVVRFE
jgi:predicted GNAT family acetyltransferase